MVKMEKYSFELTRVNPDRNIFSINVELTSTFFSLQKFGPSPSPNVISAFQKIQKPENKFTTVF